MNDDLYNENVRRFLLNDLPEAERVEYEQSFLADEDLAAQTLVVEDELIEEYLRDELLSADRQRFETAYITHLRRRERVLALKAVIAAADAEGKTQPKQASPIWPRWSVSRGFPRLLPRLVFASVLLIAIAITAWWLLPRIRRPDSKVAEANTHLPQRPVAESPTPLSMLAPTPSVTASPRSTPSPESPSSRPVVATIVLQPSLVRDPSAAKRLVVPYSVKQIRLQLILEDPAYKTYVVAVSTVDGKVVWQGKGIAGTRRVIEVSIPAHALPTNDYLVELQGLHHDILANYFFTVVTK